MTAWSSLVHLVLIWCLSSSRSVMHVLYTLSCSIPHTLQSTGFKSGELEATVEAEWIQAFLFLQKWHFLMTSSQLRHYVVSCKYWYNILQFFSRTYCQDDLCQKLWKVVYVCQKLRPKYCLSLLSGHCRHVNTITETSPIIRVVTLSCYCCLWMLGYLISST